MYTLVQLHRVIIYESALGVPGGYTIRKGWHPSMEPCEKSSRNPLSMQSTLLSPSAFEKFLQISIKIKYGLLEHVILFLCPLVNFFCENNTIEVMTQLYKFR